MWKNKYITPAISQNNNPLKSFSSVLEIIVFFLKRFSLKITIDDIIQNRKCCIRIWVRSPLIMLFIWGNACSNYVLNQSSLVLLHSREHIISLEFSSFIMKRIDIQCIATFEFNSEKYIVKAYGANRMILTLSWQ